MYGIYDFEDWKLLADDTFGIVYRCKCKLDQKNYAIKVLPFRERHHQRVAKKEIYVLKLLRGHPYIVYMYGSFVYKKQMYIILQYHQKGDLLNRCPMYNKSMVQTYFRQIVEAIQHCHKHGVIYCDIKPENVLLSDDSSHVMLCDFGLAQIVAASIYKDVKLKKACGTTRFISPEVWGAVHDPKKYFDYRCDIWGLGGLLADMAYAHDGMINSEHVFMNFSKGIWPKNIVPSRCRDLITRCLVRDPSKRLSLEDILLDPFFH